MAKRSEFVDWLLEELAPWRPVQARGMFGGFGLTVDTLFFGIVADDELYLKADEVNKPLFEAAGCQPFTYGTKHGKTIALSYFQPPESVLDDGAELVDWVRGSLEAASRAARTAKPKPKKKRIA